MPITKPEMILIDVDGTLVDSVPDLAYCVNEMLKQLGMPERDEQSIRHWVGNGVERLVKRGLINALDGEPDEALFEKALPIFRELYAVNTSVRSHLYDGVLEGLDYMKGAGYRLGCVTNKAGEFTLPILRDLGIADYLEVTTQKARSIAIADCGRETIGSARVLDDDRRFAKRCEGGARGRLSNHLPELWLQPRRRYS